MVAATPAAASAVFQPELRGLLAGMPGPSAGLTGVPLGPGVSLAVVTMEDAV